MTTLCIDELSTSLKRRWGWSSAATHVPSDAECPVFPATCPLGAARPAASERAVVPEWLQPGTRRGNAGLHGKVSPTVG